MRLGIGIIGEVLDSGSDRDRRWNRFRPSVALALQQNEPLEQVAYLYQPSQHSLAKKVLADITACVSDANIPCPVLTIHPVEFPDPWSLDSAFDVLRKTIDDVLTSQSSAEELFLHINTGTHIMQMAMHIIVDHQFPAGARSHLIQTRPGVEGEDKAHRNTIGARARILDLSYDPYPSIRGAIDVLRHSGRMELLGTVDTANPALSCQVDELIDLSSRTNEPILLLGETGTGKTWIAKKIHSLWSRAMKKGQNSPFRDINCAGLDTGVLESELFGHTKGAFTGAGEEKIGMLEAADGGTLFLDEIGDMSPKVQGSLLKAIETKTFYKVGSAAEIKKSDFRLICATNHPLDKLVKDGKFRLDLYARIRSWSYPLPPLRERTGDVPALVDMMLRKWAAGPDPRPRVFFEPHALEAYLTFAQSPEAIWTGNLRDLQQSIGRLATRTSLKDATLIGLPLVNDEISNLRSIWGQAGEVMSGSTTDLLALLEEWARQNEPKRPLLDATEVLLRKEVLGQCGGNKAQVARRLYLRPGASHGGNNTTKFDQRGARLDKQLL